MFINTSEDQNYEEIRKVGIPPGLAVAEQLSDPFGIEPTSYKSYKPRAQFLRPHMLRQSLQDLLAPFERAQSERLIQRRRELAQRRQEEYMLRAQGLQQEQQDAGRTVISGAPMQLTDQTAEAPAQEEAVSAQVESGAVVVDGVRVASEAELLGDVEEGIGADDVSQAEPDQQPAEPTAAPEPKLKMEQRIMPVLRKRRQ
ncbi:MAG: hypothetical protein MHM6MM_008071 [Cercozoa sp. M6MM]